MKKELKNNQIVIYQAKNGQVVLDVKLEKETVWLTQDQMADLFDKSKSTINEHIQNIYDEKELVLTDTMRKFGNSEFSTKPTNYYNLDVIISVGYRVKSLQGTQFRIWANKVLKDYLVKGYAINQKRLEEQAKYFQQLQQAIKFIREKSQTDLLTGKSSDLIDLIDEFAQSFTLLNQYDHGKLKLQHQGKETYQIKYNEIEKVIADFKRELMKKKEATDLVGQEISDKFKSIINNIYQTFDARELYASLEEKAAHLLYLTIKDHPFTDGNKRIASLIFIYFLAQNQYLYRSSGEKKINDNALVSLALLIAVSDPRDKDVIIKIITNLLK